MNTPSSFGTVLAMFMTMVLTMGVACKPSEQSGSAAPDAMAPPPDSQAQATSTGEPAPRWPSKTYYRELQVGDAKIFYREAGDPSWPTVLLLHGYPSSSHTYRELIPLLSGRYHVIAPDYIGCGFSTRLDPKETRYTFDLLAEYTLRFIDAIELDDYVLYMQDFGAPVGFRVAMAKPEALRALVVQNANAYLDGLTEKRQQFFRAAHEDRSPQKLAELDAFAREKAIKNFQYLRDVPGEKQARMSPDAWTHDLALLPEAEDRAIQVQLFQDYQTNIDAYPSWQKFLREHQPPTLVMWGEHDPAFIAAGARAYARDLPNAKILMLDAGHFAIEERSVEAAKHMIEFIESLPTP